MRSKKAAAAGEGYGTRLQNEPEPFSQENLPNPWIALAPPVIVGVTNKLFTMLSPKFYGETHTAALQGMAHPVVTQISTVAAIWAVECTLVLGILTAVIFAFQPINARFAESPPCPAAAWIPCRTTVR